MGLLGGLCLAEQIISKSSTVNLDSLFYLPIFFRVGSTTLMDPVVSLLQ